MNTVRTTPILYCFDDGFTECSLVSAYQALKLSPTNTEVYLVHNKLTPLNFQRVNNFTSKFSSRVHSREFIEELPKIKGTHFTNFALARLFEIMRFNDKVLYLDGDTLPRKPLNGLLSMDIGGKAIGAAICPTHISWWYKSLSSLRPGHKRNSSIVSLRLSQLKLSTIEHYVNSGVMLADPSAIRRLNLEPGFVDVETAAQCRWADQDHINMICSNSIQLIDSTYNSIWGNLALRNSVIPRALQASQHEAMTDPVIVHFAGKQKPWRHDKQRIGMKLRQLTTRRVERKFTQEWLQARDQLYASLGE